MAGTPEFSRAKRLIHFHTSHKSIFEGSETQHVKTNLTASIDGNYEIKSDRLTLTGSLLVDKNASIDGNVSVGGNLKYDQLTTASALTTDPTLEGATGLGVAGTNDGWVKVFDITTATSVYLPCWNRST